MSLLQRSPYYRTDVWVGRLAASPVTAVSGLLAGVALTVALYHRPVLELGYWWLAFAIVPGLWLMLASLLYVMHLTFRLFGSDTTREMLGPKDLKSTIFRREALAFAVVMGLIPATIGWNLDGPVSSERFHNCVKGLREPGLRYLASKTHLAMPIGEFQDACWGAFKEDQKAAVKPPKTHAELLQRFGPR